MAFDITKALGDIGRRPAGTEAEGRRDLRYIPLQKIDTNPRNFYSVEGIDELAENIRLFGLMEPLIVKELPSGRYMLISGHRRRLALRQIAEGAENYPDSMQEPVACLVEPEGAPLPGIEPGAENELHARQLAEELKLIYANADTRVMSSADTAWQIRRIRELFTELQGLGYKFPGKMRDHVAAAAKVSATRVARLDVIDKGLTEPTLRQAWKDGTLGETSAYEIARRSPEAQHAAATFTGPEALQKMTTEQVVGTMDYYASRAEEDRRTREDWNRNVGTMAKAAKDAEPKKNTGSDFSADEYLKQRQDADDEFFEALAEMADHYFSALGAVNTRQEGIERLKKGFRHNGGCNSTIDYQGSGKGLTLQRFAPRRGKEITRTWTDVYDMLCTIALSDEALKAKSHGKVSAADTGPKWKTGTPTEIGEYAVVCGTPKAKTYGSFIKSFKRWNGESWADERGVPLRLNVYEWIKLPEE